MERDIPEKDIDVTGIELTPGDREVCLGNGEQGFDCCCDECDYMGVCYPEFDIPNEENTMERKTREIP